MTVRVQKNGFVTTIIIDRPKARNAMNPETADLLVAEIINLKMTIAPGSRCSLAAAGRSAPVGISSTQVQEVRIWN